MPTALEDRFLQRQVSPSHQVIRSSSLASLAQGPKYAEIRSDVSKCWRCNLPLEGGKLHQLPHSSLPDCRYPTSVNAGGAPCRWRSANCTVISVHGWPIIAKRPSCNLAPEVAKLYRLLHSSWPIIFRYYSTVANNIPIRSSVACVINTM